jgi:hypothetical protein
MFMSAVNVFGDEQAVVAGTRAHHLNLAYHPCPHWVYFFAIFST